MSESIETSASTMDRINLRLPPEIFQAIDDRRERRAGSVSRNTWIAEAITEKLAREASETPDIPMEQAANA
ncbi:hypothetical protein Xlen_10865 [Xanthomonas campestris pv. leeana]|nr:hypothetical protein Xths_01350 [Xanthomonas campestris pv. thespesiae]OOW81304.1 hypothetical protein Xlen_10865 [Xanthomonas campestris pv. leeana]